MHSNLWCCALLINKNGQESLFQASEMSLFSKSIQICLRILYFVDGQVDNVARKQHQYLLVLLKLSTPENPAPNSYQS